jgi:flagellum-specific peptidoglycan hydrolase FlgJ
MIRFCLSTIVILITSCAFASDFRFYYIDQYKDIAMQEMDRTGVPASIKLAQGILESNYGRSDLATQANNHFGIKCGGSWDGRTYYKEDDDFDKDGNLVKSCFRVFRSAEACYIAHSDFLRDPNKSKRYGFLFSLDPLDYASWARGLKQAGYATSLTYHDKLIAIIEKFQLFQYDRIPGAGLPFVQLPNPWPSTYNNDVRYVLADKNESLTTIARKSAVSLSQLIKYNEQLTDGEQRLAEGTMVYLQSKRNNYRGKSKHHTVSPGESMFDISQRYGLKLSKLLSRNLMAAGMEPAPGERITLRGTKVKKRPLLQHEFQANTAQNATAQSASAAQRQTASINSMSATATPAVMHRVVGGDTLWNIAQRYKITVNELRTINNLTDDQIQIGQQLRIK